MAPKPVRGKGGKRGGAGGSTGVSGSADPPAPVDPVAQAAYLAAQLAAQAAMAASVNVPVAAVPLGRTASGHSLRLSAGAAARARSVQVPVQYYVHPQLGTMPNIVPPRPTQVNNCSLASIADNLAAESACTVRATADSECQSSAALDTSLARSFTTCANHSNFCSSFSNFRSRHAHSRQSSFSITIPTCFKCNFGSGSVWPFAFDFYGHS